MFISDAAVAITRDDRYVCSLGSMFLTSIAPQQFQFLTSTSSRPSALPSCCVERLYECAVPSSAQPG
jgi:hypothetical protein